MSTEAQTIDTGGTPPAGAAPAGAAAAAGPDWRQVSGGLLMQTPDTGTEPGDFAASWQLVSGRAADASLLADLEFAWRACRAVKSNAILLAAGQASVGIGMGQVNRVDSCRLAVARAGDRAAGLVEGMEAWLWSSRLGCPRLRWPGPGHTRLGTPWLGRARPGGQGRGVAG